MFNIDIVFLSCFYLIQKIWHENNTLYLQVHKILMEYMEEHKIHYQKIPSSQAYQHMLFSGMRS